MLYILRYYQKCNKPRNQISKYPIFYNIECFITVNYWHKALIFNDTLSTVQIIVKQTHNNSIHFVWKTFEPFRRVNKVCYSQQCLNLYCLITWWNASYMNSLIKIEMNDTPLFAWNPHISPLTNLRHHH